MVSSEEKKALIEYIIQSIERPIRPEDMQNRVHELLLNDTVNGKLYKYRTFDNKGFSLKNLREGTLHCPNPKVFNDPFDGTIGISLSLLCEEQFIDEFQKTDDIKEAFFNVLDNKVNIEEYSKEEQNIINKLLNNPILLEVINKFRDVHKQDGINCSAEEIKTIVKEYLYIIFTDDLFASKLGKYKDEVMSFIDMITPEGAELLIENEEFSFTDFAWAIDIKDDADEADLAISIGEKIYPDKQEDISNFKNAINNVSNTLSNFMKGLYYVGSLCTSYKNRLMWSHYADSHKGFCIEYDFSTVKNEKLLLPVYYSSNRPLLSMELVSKSREESMPEYYRQVIMGVLTKDKVWEYENEWRILVPATLGIESMEYKMPKISCIYLGESISIENREKILEIAKELKILVKQMKVDIGKYDLHAEDIIV